MKIIFLGTGGGRWTTITQAARTGGFRLHYSKRIHIDPGPGALVSLRDQGISPLKTDGVIVTHCHPDHCNDAELLIEAMTNGMTRQRGVVAASKSVFYGHNGLGPCISKHHQSKVGSKIVLEPHKRFEMGEISLEALPTKHGDSTNTGLKIHSEFGNLVYTSDTAFFDGLSKNYMDSRIIIFNVVRPGDDRIPWHLCTDDVKNIVKEIEPELVIIQHFGMKMIGKTHAEAKSVEDATGIKTVAATDGMEIDLSELME
ncbi:MAG: MBL fold metallo-hydrolase [Candidatus Hydrothermarchaeaceae archaeon]